MTDIPPKPKRRRWRSLIAVGVAAVLISGLWWAGRPQIDPRFVGKWRYKVDLAIPVVYELNKNGSGRYTSGLEEAVIQWRSDGETIFISRPGIGHLLQLLPRKVRRWMQEPGGATFGPPVETPYEVLDAGPDAVTLQMTRKTGRVPPPFTWIRLPE